MIKKIIPVIRLIFQKIIGYFLSILIPRNDNYIAVGCFVDNLNMFMHNTKYLYLFLNNTKSDYKCVWLTDDKNIINKLKISGYKNIYKRTSLSGIFYALRAKYWLYDYYPTSVSNKMFCNGAILVNLWHGTGSLKKCGQDDTNNFVIKRKGNWQSKIYNIIKFKDTYFNVDSEHEGFYRKSSQGATDNQIVINGSPRLDVLFKDFSNSELFMEEDFNYIKAIKLQGKKLFFYVPTFRETKEDISSWLKSKSLEMFLQKNNAVLVCKLHPFDKNSLNFELNENLYKMSSQSDLHVILKYMDAMITDYSSVYFDFLLLNKPIIYYVPDLEEYQEKCRGFYEPYENLTAGIKVRTESELINAMQDVLNNVDNYEDDRARLREQIFKYQDGNNCERVINWIRSLNNVKNS